MTKHLWISLIVLCGCGVIWTARAGAEEGVAAVNTIKVDGGGRRTTVSPMLYGVFFEEINHAGEGGLYAEMVLNRDFETVNLPAGAGWAGNLLKTRAGWQERKWFGNELHGWSVVATGQARGAIKLDKEHPLSEPNPHAMRMTWRTGDGTFGVANGGFWGMNFVKGGVYDLSLFARTEGAQRYDLTITLESGGGHRTFASQVIKDVGGEWQEYRCSFTAAEADPAGRLVIRMSRPGTIWLDCVSLFPRDTFKGRPNGLRRDVAEAIEAMKPAFVRFPGGAIVGGLCLNNRIKWRDSVGPIHQRKGTMNLWGYYTTNGLGFHEYLQFCEDIQAAALWVCNPGLSDNYRKAEYAKPEEVDGFVKEAMDALEYALGPVESPMGRLRAENGHPEPFPLRYIEIGNEASGKEYQDNYAKFYTTIKAKYPQLTVISNTKVPASTVEMIDHHKYGVPEAFFGAYGRYDEEPRDGPRIYVGEYGVNRGVGEGNLMAALAEAAFLMGLERNSDVVVMSSYAPLLFNVNDVAWPVNMIAVDSSRVVGRSSYHVQRMLSHHRPDEVLATTVTLSREHGKPPLFALAGVDKGAGEVVLKVVNRSGERMQVKLVLEGLSLAGERGTAVTLSHSSPWEENSLSDPELIVPRRSEVGLENGQYVFEAYSLTVLRLRLK